MGNDQSQMSDLEIDHKAVEVTDFWTHYSASVSSGNTNDLSVFIGEPLFGGSLWQTQTPLEKSSKNLMLYRHPCILRYVSSWNKSSKYYLAVEDVRPLSHVLSTLSSLQICIGLFSILKALCFLHEKASVSHNNVCTASVYVTKDGSWKLGGMEYLCAFKDLNSDYLGKTRNNRYEKAIDPNEDKNVQNVKCCREFIDAFGFAVLACEVLKNMTNDEIPSLLEFLSICRNDLQNVDVTLRPKLDSLLDHSFFNHDFIMVHSFLTELPLKTDLEKTVFFHDLVEKLKLFGEEVVASQMGSLLLSRMVLLNKTAQNEFLPYVLQPQKDGKDEKKLFGVETFKKYLVPKLLDIFSVRDAEIRKLLLKYFVNYMECFDKEDLQSLILPELLVGIKDTNDDLVSSTLHALADLIPILGSTTVIGGKRAKLFNDGRPIAHSTKLPNRSTRNSRSNVHIIPNNTVVEGNSLIQLPERPRPDGEEVTSAEEVDQSAEEDLDNWEDWDVNENTNDELTIDIQNIAPLSTTSVIKKTVLPDITVLDIKNQRTETELDEFDFFRDMEPVIESSSKFLIDDIKSGGDGFKKLDFTEVGMQEDGWGDGEWDT